MKKILNKTVTRHIILSAIICLFIITAELTDIGCPFAFISGFPCPTCGVTRAMYALFRLDISAYIAYNPMALLLCVAALLAIHQSKLPHKKLIWIYVITVAVINILVWFVKFFV